MDDDVEYAGRLLGGRYRLPRAADDVAGPDGFRAYDTASGQEVVARRVLLPEVVEAEFADDGGATGRREQAPGEDGGATRGPADTAVRRAVDAAQAALRIPDHPRLDQVYDVFVEGDELWIVSELLGARPLSELITERPLSPHRAAEIAADVLAALRSVHRQGWVHRNVTPRTVVVCEDGRAMLTGLAAGAAEEALCGLDPLPGASPPAAEPRGAIPPPGHPGRRDPGGGTRGQTTPTLPSAAQSPLPAGFHRDGRPPGAAGPAARAARGGAVAAYRAGTQAAAARVAAEARGRHGDQRAESPGSRATAPEPYGPHGRPYASPAASDHGDGFPGGPGDEPALPPGHASTAGQDTGAVPAPRPEPGRAVATRWPQTAPDREPEAPAHRGTPSGPGAVAPGRHRGPTTALEAERARQARMTTVGAVTERWAPEQAGPVHENWRLAPPVGPSADLWALGVLLFRAVQGHAPYPEDEVGELVQRVCAEPPARAEECGPLRPVVESLLRQDPTERPDFEVLRGWLRSLIRSAPEPEVGRHTLTAPPSLEPGRPSDPHRLPMLRRRGELVRRRRAGRRATAARTHRRTTKAPRPRRTRPARPPRAAHAPAAPQEAPPPREARPRPSSPGRSGAGRSPRSLGRFLLGGVLLLLTAAVLYAMWFMPERNQADEGNRRSSVGTPDAPAAPTSEAGDGTAAPDDDTPADDGPRTGTQPQAPDPSAPADGFRMHEDPVGFRIAVPEGWDRSGPNDRGQVRFDRGEFELVVVKGRDAAGKFGRDPMTYQSESEPELAPFRTSDWSSASGLRRIDVGDTAMAEGTYTWQDASGREVYVRNRAMLLGGRYHLVLVIGPRDERDAVDRWFEGAVDTYRVLR